MTQDTKKQNTQQDQMGPDQTCLVWTGPLDQMGSHQTRWVRLGRTHRYKNRPSIQQHYNFILINVIKLCPNINYVTYLKIHEPLRGLKLALDILTTLSVSILGSQLGEQVPCDSPR